MADNGARILVHFTITTIRFSDQIRIPKIRDSADRLSKVETAT
jgi:hypothetical protein